MTRKSHKNGRKNGSLTEDDRQVWENVLKTVRPYSKRKAVKEEVPKPPAPKTPAPKIKAPPQTPPVAPSKTAAPSKGFDRATATKFRRGQLEIEGRIDLHGMTQDKAHAALQNFVRRAAQDGRRNLLIITGKGDGKSTGVLKRMLPLWLEEGDLRHAVLALAPAQPRDGGGGAFYLRLRRDRNHA